MGFFTAGFSSIKSSLHMPATKSDEDPHLLKYPVVPPNTLLQVFSHRFDEKYSDQEIQKVRKQFSDINLKAEGRDIYNNRIIAKRELIWFMRHDTNGEKSYLVKTT